MATPPVFTAGQVLTAAQVNAIGLWLVKTHTLPTGTNTTTITGAFSSDFANYKIMAGDAKLTGIANISMKMGSTAAGYYSSRIFNAPNNGTPGGNGQNNTGDWGYAGQGSASYLNFNIDLMNPFKARYTHYSGSYVIENGADSNFGTTAGHLADTTSYTSFTLTAGGANFNGGTLYIYGYRN